MAVNSGDTNHTRSGCAG